MATTKKTETKTTAKKATAKAVEAKATAEKKAETKTTAKATAKKAETKTATKATTAKKAETKTTAKATAKKTTTTKKATAKKENNLYVQFAGMEFDAKNIEEAVKADYKAKNGKKTINSVSIYVKPEDMKAYYVIDGIIGDVAL